MSTIWERFTEPVTCVFDYRARHGMGCLRGADIVVTLADTGLTLVYPTSEEGTHWIRGHHQEDSEASQALLSAFALAKP